MNIVSFAESLAVKGVYHFTVKEAAVELRSSLVAVRAAIRRLRVKGRLATPLRGFHLIVPPEYRAIGCLPADQFVPQLMSHLGLKYYAGLLTAAALHGAAHHAPMAFQVVTAENRPGLRCGRVRVEFVARSNAAEIPTVSINTPRGVLLVSSPDATAFDLIGYPGHAGGLSNVTTVLAELVPLLDLGRLLAETAHSPLPWTQRLGYLLELVEGSDLAAPLADFVGARAREYVPLKPGKTVLDARRNKRWRLLINEPIEPDR